MKKFFLILTLSFALQNFAQKTFEIYNFSSYPIEIASIVTKIDGAATYPEFTSKPFGLFTIAPGDSYILQNAANPYRFPFESPTSTPYIDKWERLNSASSATLLTSPAAWVLGSSQVFSRLHFYINGVYYVPTVPSGVTTVTLASGGGWIMDYDCSNPGGGTVWNYTIVVY
jgi:hypothetical protein